MEDKKNSILPDDVIMDILLLLPIKSLMRFRCVNKTWLQLLTKDPQILRKLSTTTIALRSEGGEDEIYIDSALELTASDKAVHFELPFCRGPSTSKSYTIYGICNGLMWVSLTYENKNSMYLWNQLTNDYIQIPSPPPKHIHYFKPCDKSISNFGFCYLQHTNQYKAICFIECKHVSPFQVRSGSHVSVYTLGTDTSWRNLRNTNYYSFIRDCTSPIVNGALHWIAYTGWNLVRIVSFDMKDEVFQEIPHPKNANLNYNADSFNRLGLLGGLLCILGIRYYGDQNVQVWVMQEYGVANSWTKLFMIGRPDICVSFASLRPIGVGHNGEILLQEVEKSNHEFILYNPGTKSVRKHTAFRFDLCDHAYTYKPSLISPRAIISVPKWRQEHNVIEATGRKGGKHASYLSE